MYNTLMGYHAYIR